MKRKLNILLCIMAITAMLICGCGGATISTTGSEAGKTATSAESTAKTEASVSTETHEHSWVEATCTTPKTCSTCNATEGEPLEHDFAKATLNTPKTCKLCGLTEGNPVEFKEINLDFMWEHDFHYVSSTAKKVICGSWNKNYACIYDLNGELVGERIPLPEEYETTYYRHILTRGVYNCVMWYCFDFEAQSPENKDTWAVNAYLSVYDMSGKKLFDYEYSMDVPQESLYNFDWYSNARYEKDGVLKLTGDYGTVVHYIDISTGTDITEEEYLAKPELNDWYSHDEWYYCEKFEDIGLSLVTPPEQEYWGYMDEAGNVVAQYADASGFTKSGYALVSNDRQIYDLIDSELNVVLPGAVYGSSASCNADRDVLTVKDPDGYYRYYHIE